MLRQIIARAGPPPPSTEVRALGTRRPTSLPLHHTHTIGVSRKSPELTPMRPPQPEKYSFWIGNIVPTSTAEKLRMLVVTSTAQRLAQLKLLLQVRYSAWIVSCQAMTPFYTSAAIQHQLQRPSGHEHSADCPSRN